VLRTRVRIPQRALACGCKSDSCSRSIFNYKRDFLLCERRLTASQFVLAPSPLKLTTRDVFWNWNLAVMPLLASSLTEGRLFSYSCCWLSPAQPFSGPSSCFALWELRLSQPGQSQSCFATDNQSVCLGVEPTLGLATRCCLPFEGSCLKFAVLSLSWAPSLTRGRVCHLWSQPGRHRVNRWYPQALGSLAGPTSARGVPINNWRPAFKMSIRTALKTQFRCSYCVRVATCWPVPYLVVRLLVVRVPGYRYRGPGTIPGATRFCEFLHGSTETFYTSQ
jgi:hypothetical protein